MSIPFLFHILRCLIRLTRLFTTTSSDTFQFEIPSMEVCGKYGNRVENESFLCFSMRVVLMYFWGIIEKFEFYIECKIVCFLQLFIYRHRHPTRKHKRFTTCPEKLILLIRNENVKFTITVIYIG